MKLFYAQVFRSDLMSHVVDVTRLDTNLVSATRNIQRFVKRQHGTGLHIHITDNNGATSIIRS